MVVEAVVSARTPLVLLVVAFLFGAYLFAFERDGPKQSEVEARDGFLLEPLVRERVTGIVLERGNEVVTLRREGEGFDETWFLEEPAPGDGNLETIEDFMRNWEFAMPTRTLEEPSADDMVAFGLDAPTSTVTFEMGSAQVRVALGSGTPVDGGGYVRIDDRAQAIVVPEAVVELFDFDLEAFRDQDGPEPTLDDLVTPDEAAVIGASEPEATPSEDSRTD